LLAAGAITATILILGSNPIGWIATAAIVAGLGIALIAQKASKQKVLFEVSAIGRLAHAKNHDKIEIPGWANKPANANLLLGGLPNRLRSDALMSDLKGRGAVLSINEKFETKPQGLSIPFSEQAWKNRGVEFKHLLSDDHALVSPAEMNEAADWIHAQMSDGKNVLVHCRAGVGRSATALAALLMKYGEDAEGKPLTLEAICIGIKGSRAKSTIWNKLPALKAFDESLGIARPKSSPLYCEMLAKSEVREAAGKKIKMSKADIKAIMTP
jgi:rhodanese-related sulfurtransferase